MKTAGRLFGYMGMAGIFLGMILFLALLSIPAQAQGVNQTTNITLTSNITSNATNSSDIQSNTSILLANSISITVNQTVNTSANTTASVQPNITTTTIPIPEPRPEPIIIPAIFGFDLARVIPGDVKIGDSQLNLLIRNTGNQNLTNIDALITGEGISVYNQEPIGIIYPGDSKFILAWINTKKTGKIPVSIRIQDKMFTAYIRVVDSEQTALAKKSAEEASVHRRKMHEAQEELSNLSDIFEAYQKDYVLKESKGYVLTSINLQDAKGYLRNAQSGLAKDDLTESSANLVLLRAELSDLRERLMAAELKPRTLKDFAKDNIPLLSGLLGIAVGGIAVYEKLKHKTEALKKNGFFGKKLDDKDETDEEE